MSKHKTMARSGNVGATREQGLATPPPTSPIFAAYGEEELLAAETLLKMRYGSPVARTLVQEAREAKPDQAPSSPDSCARQVQSRKNRRHFHSSPPTLTREKSSSPTLAEHVRSSPRTPSLVKGPISGLGPLKGTFSTSLKPLQPSRRGLKPSSVQYLELSYTPIDQLRDTGPSSHNPQSVVLLRNASFPKGIFPPPEVVDGTDRAARQAFVNADNSALSGGNVIAAVQRGGPEVTLSRGIFPSEEVVYNIWPRVRRDFQAATSSFSGGDVFAALKEGGRILEHNENKADVAALRRRIARESSNNAWYRARRRDARDESADEELDWDSDDAAEE